MLFGNIPIVIHFNLDEKLKSKPSQVSVHIRSNQALHQN